MYPSDGPRSRASHAEVKVYNALRAQLPSGWTAWHSLRVRVAGKAESEGDFVIAAPGLGLLVLEVKGGRIELIGGRWLQNGTPLGRAPREQALGVGHLLHELLRKRGVIPPPFEVASVFADTEFSAPPDSADLTGLVLGAMELPWIGQLLPSLLERALGDRSPPRDDHWIRAIHALWGETWVPSVTLAHRAELAARRRIELDNEQLALLDFAGDLPRAVIDGGAGSGKTIVALELIARRARKGQRALYLCFTDALARAAARSLEHDPELASHARAGHARATTIRRYARDLLATAGHELPAPTTAFWNEVSFNAACAALPPHDERPDLVVVDESQDLEPSDWMLVEELARGRDLWAFGDERQRFWLERALPPDLVASATRLHLKLQHRAPEALASFAAAYADGPLPVRRPDPTVLRLVVAADPLDRVRHEVAELCRAGAHPRDIAVLTLAGRERSRLLTLGKLGAQQIVLADDDAAPEQVVADTFLRFKGLERPYIIVTEPLHGAGMKYATRMHIALTRAMVAAIIVCDEESVAKDERLVWLRG